MRNSVILMTFFLKKLKTVYESVYVENTMKQYTEPKIYHGGKSFNLFKRINSIIAASTPKGDKVSVMYSL
ncbi:MAG: hypothetical protein J6581_07725 [Apibacter sp.]|nr:hypothetical protein [Apibacter sp.]